MSSTDDFRRDGAVALRGVLGMNAMRWAPRPHRTSPPFPELDGVLGAGDPLEHPLFPVLWRARMSDGNGRRDRTD